MHKMPVATVPMYLELLCCVVSFEEEGNCHESYGNSYQEEIDSVSV